MIKPVKLVFFIGLLISQSSCRIVLPVQSQTTSGKAELSDYVLVVKMAAIEENISNVMYAINRIKYPTAVEENYYSNWYFSIRELTVRFHAVGNNAMQEIQNELLICRGVHGVSIVRL